MEKRKYKRVPPDSSGDLFKSFVVKDGLHTLGTWKALDLSIQGVALIAPLPPSSFTVGHHLILQSEAEAEFYLLGRLVYAQEKKEGICKLGIQLISTQSQIRYMDLLNEATS